MTVPRSLEIYKKTSKPKRRISVPSKRKWATFWVITLIIKIKSSNSPWSHLSHTFKKLRKFTRGSKMLFWSNATTTKKKSKSFRASEQSNASSTRLKPSRQNLSHISFSWRHRKKKKKWPIKTTWPCKKDTNRNSIRS